MANPIHSPHHAAQQQSDENALESTSVMQTFRTRVQNFWNTFRNLQARSSEVPSELKAEYDDIMRRGAQIRSTIESITTTYDAAAEWISDVFGLSSAEMGLDGVRWRDALSGNLGALPFVPLGIIAGTSLFIVKWLKDAYTMERKLTEHRRLIDAGHDPARASEIVNKTISGPGLFNFNINWQPVLIVGGLGLGLWLATRRGWL